VTDFIFLEQFITSRPNQFFFDHVTMQDQILKTNVYLIRYHVHAEKKLCIC